MQVLKLEQNIFEELGKLSFVTEEVKGESIFRSIDIDFYDTVKKITVEKRKYPYFYKYFFQETINNLLDLSMCW